jgi:hypothetical protein
VVLVGLAVGGATLQVMGPPGGRVARSPDAQAAVAPARVVAGPIAAPGPTAAPLPIAAPVPITAPDAELLEHAPGDPSAALLPRIAADGRAPMRVYAAEFDPATQAPRIGIVIAGVGLDETESDDAIRALPAAITLAVSPYAPAPENVAAAARRAGHEYLISIPLEPAGYGLNDPGQHALLTGASPAENAQRLDWVLSRLTGYVGATGALGDMRGERFADVPEQMDPMLATLARRGLLYVDPRQGKARLPHVWSRAVDVVIDDPPSAASIDARLAELLERAHNTGAALGLIGVIRPVTMEHLVAWVGSLGGRGFALAPVSALVTAPEGAAPGGVTPGRATPGGAAAAGATTGGATTGGATTGGATTGGATAEGATTGGATVEAKPPGGRPPQ